MRVLLRLALLGLVIATASPPRALADPAAPARDPATVKLAKQYVDAGLAAQAAHDYDTAIALYSRAYQLVPHPLLIFNLAQAHRLAGHPDKALVLYRRYLAEDPEGAQATIARGFVAELLERQAEKQRAAQAAAHPEPLHKEPSTADAPGEPAGVRPAGAVERQSEAPAADRAAPSGAIVVVARSQTGGAIPRGTVLVDDERKGELADGKLVIPRLAGGSHRVAIEAGGYQRFERAATVRSGERATLDAQLVDASPAPASRNASPWKWALGASAGLTLGGAVFTVYSATRSTEAARQIHPPVTGQLVTASDCGKSPAALGLTSPQDVSAFNQACAWHSREIVGLSVAGVALAATVVSLVMVTREPGTPEPAIADHGKHEVAIAPIVAPGVGGASLSVAW